MRIGVNIQPLQNGHRMRGIGAVVTNFINNISAADRLKHSFVFYMLRNDDEAAVLRSLDLDGLDYTIEYLQVPQPTFKFHLPSKLNLIVSLANKSISFIHLSFGRSLPKGGDLDVYLHTDQSENMPRGRSFKKIMIAYDIIPYVLEWEYLHSYHTARLHGEKHRVALRAAINRWKYKKRLKVNSRRANHVLAISTHTKNDFTKFLRTPADKISVCPLGVSPPEITPSIKPNFRYFPTSWGYFRRTYKFDTDTRFLLYVGGADPRRKLEDLVTAFNNLRGLGYDLKLVLTGDTMQGPRNIATLTIQKALGSSSYLDDIIFLGFVDESTRNWLYEHALAFVYPSQYEGFGLPVLEAMIHGCPVICYDNAAVREIASNVPYYANSPEDIKKHIIKLSDMSPPSLVRVRSDHIAHGKKFSWVRTSKNIMSRIENL